MTTTSYTEFCCRSGGSNLCAGTLTGQSTEQAIAPTVNYTGGTIGGVAGLGQGTWTAATNIFLPPTGRNPVSDGIAIGQFASIYSGTPTATGFVARVTAVVNATNGAITVSSAVLAGSKPAGAGAAMSMVIGGAWLGPNTTDQAFPHTIAALQALVTVTTSYPTRINYKNDQTYNITATTIYAGGGPLRFQGYTTTYGDGGKATLDGGTSGASYILWNLTATSSSPDTWDFIFQNNGASGSASGFIQGGRSINNRVVVNNVQGAGFNIGSSSITDMIECEAYACNLSNTASLGGFLLNTSINLIRCISHDNTGNNTRGFHCPGSILGYMNGCIADSNGLSGLETTGTTNLLIQNCDFYNNGVSAAGSGFYQSAGNPCVYFENCNFILNNGFGIRFTTGTVRTGQIQNCGFGSGTQVNGSGDIDRTNIGAIGEDGTITYASGVTPWKDPANGDFRIVLPAAKATGRGTFTETATSYTGTIGYPDVGAAQARKNILINPGLAGGLR